MFKIGDFSRLTRVSVKTLHYYDAFEAVSQVYAALGKWIEANGYRINGASREIYVQTPDWSTKDRVGVMEIQFPVEKV